jgi:hypothetical protein
MHQAALRAALAAARVEADAASSAAQQMREVEERKLRDALASAQEVCFCHNFLGSSVIISLFLLTTLRRRRLP